MSLWFGYDRIAGPLFPMWCFWLNAKPCGINIEYDRYPLNASFHRMKTESQRMLYETRIFFLHLSFVSHLNFGHACSYLFLFPHTFALNQKFSDSRNFLRFLFLYMLSPEKCGGGATVWAWRLKRTAAELEDDVGLRKGGLMRMRKNLWTLPGACILI